MAAYPIPAYSCPCAFDDGHGRTCGRAGQPVVAEGEELTPAAVRFLCPSHRLDGEERGHFVHLLTLNEYLDYLEALDAQEA